MNDTGVPGGLESDPLGFPEFGLNTALLEALGRLGHAVPTPIQQKAIPPAMAGTDVLGCAQTGTGKTAAFCLPLLQRFDDGRGRRPGQVRALVLSPTRELAAQIGESLSEYGRGCAVSHTVVFGGVGQSAQARDLRRGVDVLIATPGRLEDLIAQRLADLSHVEVLILDEVDRMLDQGFLPAVRRISQRIPKSRQTLMFSATLPKELRQLARDLLRNPVEIAADYIASTPSAIDQKVFLVDSTLKRQALERLLKRCAFTRALVFTRTKHGADRVARHLRSVSLEAEAIHGGKTQSSRERTLAAFREGSLPILVATDLAARGLHVDDISHVINFDLPLDPENYVHRIGRTARAGASGQAISLCSHDERESLQRIERLIQRKLEVMRDPSSNDMLESRPTWGQPPPKTLDARHTPAGKTEGPARGVPAKIGHTRLAPIPLAPARGEGLAAKKGANRYAPLPKPVARGEGIPPTARAKSRNGHWDSPDSPAPAPKPAGWRRHPGQRAVRRDWQT